jgi:hypothetical protein
MIFLCKKGISFYEKNSHTHCPPLKSISGRLIIASATVTGFDFSNVTAAFQAAGGDHRDSDI